MGIWGFDLRFWVKFGANIQHCRLRFCLLTISATCLLLDQKEIDCRDMQVADVEILIHITSTGQQLFQEYLLLPGRESGL